MSVKPTAAEKQGITFIRMGVGKQEFELPEGATLADLLRAAGVDLRKYAIFIDGKPLDEVLVLHPGTIVSAVPKAKKRGVIGEWRDVIGAFHNDPAFDAMMAVVEAERAAEKEGP